MSNKGGPSDPFGRSERTIIRPNPAGRRAVPPQASPAVPAGGDEWAVTPPPPPPAEPQRQRAPIIRREQLLTPNANPVMRAAGPLLLLLGRLRVALMRAPLAQLMEQVADAIKEFEHDIRAAGLSAEDTRTAKYVVCATADDIIQNIPGEDRHLWTQYSMLSRFFGERIGGVRFFEELDRLKADPTVNYSLLELMHACLALGFHGIHRTSSGGAAHLQMIQRNLYETLRRVRRATHELSPRWQGQAIATEMMRFKVPVWAVASLVGVLLLGLYLVLRALLGGQSEAMATALLSVHPTGEVGISRRIFSAPPPPPPASAQKERICSNVAPPITCLETPTYIVIRMSNLALFEPGSATVNNEFKPLIGRITAILEREAGPIKIVGHTDSTPISTVRFPSNYQLSIERAKAVAALIKGQLSKPDRIGVDGKGADVPVAGNASPADRAKNRRVEILIQRVS
jgi:type VI secretion system protein ImpK